jgi:hypothetical protein
MYKEEEESNEDEDFEEADARVRYLYRGVVSFDCCV